MIASRKIVVGLILAATVLFVVGILLEKSSGEHHSESVAHAETPAEHAAESGAGATPTGAGTQATGETAPERAKEPGAENHSESDEKVLGINLEATTFVVVFVLASLGLAGVVWSGRAAWMLLVVAAAMVAFSVFDIAEVFHQVDRSEGGIAALAGLVAALHLAAGLGSAQLSGNPP